MDFLVSACRDLANAVDMIEFYQLTEAIAVPGSIEVDSSAD
jgi:hypothetical protein